MTTQIQTPKDFKRFVGARDFKVVYRKANGQFRGATGSVVKGFENVKGALDEDTREARDDNGLVPYYDFEKSAIRAFKLEKIIRLEIDGQSYEFGF